MKYKRFLTQKVRSRVYSGHIFWVSINTWWHRFSTEIQWYHIYSIFLLLLGTHSDSAYLDQFLSAFRIDVINVLFTWSPHTVSRTIQEYMQRINWSSSFFSFSRNLWDFYVVYARKTVAKKHGKKKTHELLFFGSLFLFF